MKIPKDNGNTNDWLDTKKNYNWKKRGVLTKKKKRKNEERERMNWSKQEGRTERGGCEADYKKRKREGARTIGNNISIPIEATHTNATLSWSHFGGKGRRGSRSVTRANSEGQRGGRRGGCSERVKNITPSHTGADSRMKRTLTNTNNGRHKRTASRCAKNRPTHRTTHDASVAL